jgi:hypothetical protein
MGGIISYMVGSLSGDIGVFKEDPPKNGRLYATIIVVGASAGVAVGALNPHPC